MIRCFDSKTLANDLSQPSGFISGRRHQPQYGLVSLLLEVEAGGTGLCFHLTRTDRLTNSLFSRKLNMRMKSISEGKNLHFKGVIWSPNEVH